MEFTDFVIITFHTQTQMAFVLTQLVWLGMVTQPGQFQQEIAVVIGHIHPVLRFADEKQAADAAAKLKTTVDPRKWICVGVDEAKVVAKGKMVCVVMDDENGDYYINNFKANA